MEEKLFRSSLEINPCFGNKTPNFLIFNKVTAPNDFDNIVLSEIGCTVPI